MSIRRDVAEPLWVDSFAIAEHVGNDLALAAARQAAEAQVDRTTESRRLTLPLPGGWMRVMACSVPALGVFGYKEFHLGADNAVRYAVHVFDLETGRPLGVVDAALVTTLRTAATAAVAVERLVGNGSEIRLGIVGTGAEAMAGLRALTDVVRVRSIAVTSRRRANREKFLAAAGEELGIVGTETDSVAAAAAGTDVVFAATNSDGAVVVRPEDVAGVPCLASIGSTIPQQRELDGRVLVAARHVVVDTLEVLEESGDVLAALDEGLDPSRVHLLGEVLAGGLPPGTGTAVYKSIGSPAQDLVLAHAILVAGRRDGFGRAMEPLAAVKMNL